MSRTCASVWFYLISSLLKLLSKNSYHTSRRNMLLKSSTPSVRWPIGWRGKSNLMSREGETFRRKLTLLVTQIPPTPMMTSWWDRLSGFRTIRSRLRARLATRNPRSMGLTLQRLTRSLIYCYQRVRLSWSRITRSQQIKSWRTLSTASGTMQHLMTRMSVKCSVSDTVGYRAG